MHRARMSTLKKTPDTVSVTADCSDLEGLVGYNLKRAYVIVQSDFRHALGKDGLSARSFSALSLVVQNPEITQSELSRLLKIERSGLVAIVDELETHEYISRTTVPGDRRVQALVPLNAGMAAYSQALSQVQTHEKKLLANLNDSELKTLLQLLKKVRQCEG